MQLLERLSKHRSSNAAPRSVEYVCEALDAKARLHLLQTHGRQQAFATIKAYFQAAHYSVFLEKNRGSGHEQQQQQQRPMGTTKYLAKAEELLKVVLRRMRQNGEEWPTVAAAAEAAAAAATDFPPSDVGASSSRRPGVELVRLQQQVTQPVVEE